MSGIRGIAWVSIVKDILMVISVLLIGLAIPHIYFGGIGKMFSALASAKPAHLIMPGSTRNLGHAWCYKAIERSVFGLVDYAHAATAQFVDNATTPMDLGSTERSGAGLPNC